MPVRDIESGCRGVAGFPETFHLVWPITPVYLMHAIYFIPSNDGSVPIRCYTHNSIWNKAISLGSGYLKAHNYQRSLVNTLFCSIQTLKYKHRNILVMFKFLSFGKALISTFTERCIEVLSWREKLTTNYQENSKKSNHLLPLRKKTHPLRWLLTAKTTVLI